MLLEFSVARVLALLTVSYDNPAIQGTYACFLLRSNNLDKMDQESSPIDSMVTSPASAQFSPSDVQILSTLRRILAVPSRHVFEVIEYS